MAAMAIAERHVKVSSYVMRQETGVNNIRVSQSLFEGMSSMT
jgi:hypothetical protein